MTGVQTCALPISVEEGIVPGGGVALLRAKAALGKLSDANEDVQAGINIVLRALEAPIRQIAANSGVEGSIVVGRILGEKSQTFGFDAQSEQYVDMLSAGILDPAKVVRIALQDAASIAGLMITTEAMVGDKPSKDAPAMPGGGGMGGMGGMDYRSDRLSSTCGALSWRAACRRSRAAAAGRRVAKGAARKQSEWPAPRNSWVVTLSWPSWPAFGLKSPCPYCDSRSDADASARGGRETRIA